MTNDEWAVGRWDDNPRSPGARVVPTRSMTVCGSTCGFEGHWCTLGLELRIRSCPQSRRARPTHRAGRVTPPDIGCRGPCAPSGDPQPIVRLTTSAAGRGLPALPTSGGQRTARPTRKRRAEDCPPYPQGRARHSPRHRRSGSVRAVGRSTTHCPTHHVRGGQGTARPTRKRRAEDCPPYPQGWARHSPPTSDVGVRARRRAIHNPLSDSPRSRRAEDCPPYPQAAGRGLPALPTRLGASLRARRLEVIDQTCDPPRSRRAGDCPPYPVGENYSLRRIDAGRKRPKLRSGLSMPMMDELRMTNDEFQRVQDSDSLRRLLPFQRGQVRDSLRRLLPFQLAATGET